MNDVDVKVIYDWQGETKKGAAAGTVSVLVYEHGTRKRKYVSCRVRVSPDEWNEKLWVVRRDDAMQLNNKIKAQYDKCVEKLRCVAEENATSMQDVPSVKVMKVDNKKDSFLQFMNKEIKDAELADGTRKHHVSTYNALVEFGKIRKFEDITREKLEEWIKWLQKRKTTKLQDGKKVTVLVSQSTVHKQWKTLRKYIGIAQGRKLLPMTATMGMKVGEGKPEPRVFLNDAEIKAWCECELPNEHLRMTRDRFIVQMGTGLAYADMLNVDWSIREELNWMMVLNGERVKTGKPYFCVILPFAVEALERFGWQVPAISNVDYNIYLDEVAKRAGINKHVTSHVGRHTYACYCLRHGVRIEAVQRTLGHTKIQTTQIYARLAGVDVVDAFAKLR